MVPTNRPRPSTHIRGTLCYVGRKFDGQKEAGDGLKEVHKTRRPLSWPRLVG